MEGSLFLLLLAIATWLGLGLVGLVLIRRGKQWVSAGFSASSLTALVVAVVAGATMGEAPQSVVLPIGLATLPLHLRFDSLAALFLVLIGVVATGVSLYAIGYFRDEPPARIAPLFLAYQVFLASMAVVLLADDAYAFLVAWEAMALSSFLLVTTDHRYEGVRRAGYLYLLLAHVGAVAILLSFGVMAGGEGAGDYERYTFDQMRAMARTPFWSSIAFLLALVGFGAKAGLLPVHAWLPEAHPAAPSPISALMSGVMLKTAIYGLLRVVFDLLGTPMWWWGIVALGIGLVTALFGVLFATVQSDMKRLLAYSSIENIGLLVAAIGLTLLFHSYGMDNLAALALAAVLFHSLAHAGFKSLLFLGLGSVLHATHERHLGRLGGLIHRMPWVAWLTLVGILAGAGLPPLSGFVSEWLLLQGFLFTPELPQSWLNMFVPIAAAVVALVAALAGYAMVKCFGLIFLGQMRDPALSQAHDAGVWERAGLLWLAAMTLGLGLLPTQVVAWFDPATQQLLGVGLAKQLTHQGWWLLAPIAAERASYMPVAFFVAVVTMVALGGWVVHRLYHGRLRRATPWDCGYRFLTPRMQDSAEGFSQPIRRIFEPFFHMTRHFPSIRDRDPYFVVQVEDPLWYRLYLPVARLVETCSRWVARLQGGRIAIYLIYSFATLIVLLLVARP